jgi:phage tail sheath protein FI
VNDTIAQVTAQAASVDSNYVGSYYPWVKTVDTNTNKLISVPPSVLLPAVYAANDAIAAEWFAPAGLNRGGIVGAVSVLNRLTHSERDTLYENKVNPIATFPGQGIVAFGQKTLQDKASALDRINVRRLLIAVKKYIASSTRYLVFENNTAATRNRFLSIVNPYLESIQQRNGLYAFKVVMDDSNNTPDVIDRNIMVGEIYLQPTKTAEFIVLDFNILPTGAAFPEA